MQAYPSFLLVPWTLVVAVKCCANEALMIVDGRIEQVTEYVLAQPSSRTERHCCLLLSNGVEGSLGLFEPLLKDQPQLLWHSLHILPNWRGEPHRPSARLNWN